MIRNFLFFLILISHCAFAQTPDYSELQALLDLDRFEAYTEAWAGTMRGRGKAAIADAIHALEPADFRAMNLDPAKLRSAQNYDGLILEVLNRKHPELHATAEQVEWGYNFFKNKLNEAYLVSDVRTRPAPGEPLPVPEAQRVPTPLEMNPLDSGEVLLDVDAYASDRTTRAVFWEASSSRRPIELFLGSGGEFQSEMTRRGARIIGEVGTKARNYNPIYLIQNPGETGYHYAITEISGADRLRHFQLQSSLIRWTQPTGGMFPPPPVSVVGDAARTLANEERTLTEVLRSIPRSDHIVIGQKGAFERTFGSMGKINSLIQLYQADPQGVTALLNPAELRIVTRAVEAQGDISPFVMRFASDIDKLYVKATPLLTSRNLLTPPFTVFNYDRGSYEMSDYMIRGANGETQRWRIFSNVWGDEVLPIARGLKNAGYNTVNYIGTAGAFPNTGLSVGDLVIPRTAAEINGTITNINRTNFPTPEGAKFVNSVVNVQTPFEETTQWLNRAQRVSQVVEVETGYLASVFNGPNDRLNVQLLISDVVGSEDETLATAASSSRRRAQINAISGIIRDAGSVAPATMGNAPSGLAAWINEILPSRDIASQTQILREAQARNIRTRPELEEFIKTQKSFTTAKLQTVLSGAETRLDRLLQALHAEGLTPELAVTSTLLDGRFNPAAGGVGIHFASTPETEARIRAVVANFMAQDRDYKKYLDVAVSATHPEGFVSPSGTSNTTFKILGAYEDGVLRYGGLAHTENSSGALKFVRVTEASAEPLRLLTRPVPGSPGEEFSRPSAPTGACSVSGCGDCTMNALNTLLR